MRDSASAAAVLVLTLLGLSTTSPRYESTFVRPSSRAPHAQSWPAARAPAGDLPSWSRRPIKRKRKRSWKFLKEIQGNWSEVAGKTIEVDGQELYHYLYREGKREPPAEAARKFVEKLKRQGATPEGIAECEGKPRRLEDFLDEVFSRATGPGLCRKALVAPCCAGSNAERVRVAVHLRQAPHA
jgi:beta-phosphoglucomutase-like phosphatase (HAD superfamily)